MKESGSAAVKLHPDQQFLVPGVGMQVAQHRRDLDYSHDPIVLLVSAFEPVKRCIDFTTTRVHQRDIGRQRAGELVRQFLERCIGIGAPA